MVNRIIKQVTVTGADDSTSIQDMMRIQEKYPFVEWGILLSKSSEGRSRFPSVDWIRSLKPFALDLNLSGHLCGKWVRDLCKGDLSLYRDRPLFFGVFERYQLNFHAYQHKIKDRDAFIKALTHLTPNQVIFQFDDVNNDLLEEASQGGVDAVPFFDTSGGAGVLPTEWPSVLGRYCGYAGGLSPENLNEQMESISEKCGDGPIWIDAETWLRSDNDKVFDMDKVCAFLEEAKSWIIG